MAERFKSSSLQTNVGQLVRSDPLRAISVPEALRFLVGPETELTGLRKLGPMDLKAGFSVLREGILLTNIIPSFSLFGNPFLLCLL